MSGHFKQVTNGDRNRLAADMYERDIDDDNLAAGDTLRMYESAVHDVLQSATDAGWKIEVPRGWKTRPNE
jgi:hypothetical protein